MKKIYFPTICLACKKIFQPKALYKGFCTKTCSIKCATLMSIGKKRSNKTKRKMSLSHKGRISGMLGKKHSEETRKKMSEASKKHGTPWLIGKKLSEEHRRKISMANKGHTSNKKGKPWSEARRKAQEKRTGYRGRKSLILNGKEYSPDWHIIRKEIYKRDNWICQECGCHCKGKKYPDAKQIIQCHHIDYNEKNNNQENLITLCASCHCKTNFKRENWIKYYKNKLRKGLVVKINNDN